MIQKIYFLLVLLVFVAGVDKVSAGSTVLQWSASTSPDVAGYDVYYGTASGSYSNELDAGNATSLTISNLMPGVTYYFVATAYSAQGNESTYSSEVSYMVPVTLALTSGANPATLPLMQFTAATGHWYEIQATTDLVNWSSIWQSAVVTSNVVVQFSDPNAASFSSRFYRLVSY